MTPSIVWYGWEPMYSVTETIHFSYGHRLPGHPGKCAHVHGHNARVEITVAADALDERSMVVDFEEITSAVGAWIERTIDHRMLLRRDDPLVAPLRELGEPVHLMDESPTAEAIAKMIYDVAKGKGLPVSEVRLWETGQSVAVYRP